jgi:hypothetical protein
MLQVAFALGLAAIVAERVRALAWRGPVDSGAVIDALRVASSEDVVRRLPGTFAADLLEAVARERSADDSPSRAIDAALLDVRFAIGDRLRLVRGLSSLASAGGLLVAVAWGLWARYGDHGVLGLAAGGPERLAMMEGVRAVGVGLATAFFGLTSLAVLRREARARWAEVREIARHLEG